MQEDRIHEECGVFGVFSKTNCDVASTVYYGLFALQHRGQESCGIVVDDDGIFTTYKDSGIVNDVFNHRRLQELGEGNIAIGHVRYGSEKSKDRSNAQPMVVNHVKGRMALAHNGMLINGYDLRRELELTGAIFHSQSNTEVISYVITKERLTAPSIEEALNAAMYKLQGAYSIVIMSPRKLIAARDEHGFRPLCYGVTEDGRYVVASESCALDSVGATLVRELEPGEIVVFSQDGVRSITDHCNKVKPSFCVFEYVYNARPDSIIDGCSVHMARRRAGRILAKEHPVEADVVIGCPDSGLDAAMGYAEGSGIPYGIGLIKNKYIGRTFIAPGQASREDKVKIKLNPLREVVEGKRVVLVDDSIVRGTTSKRIVGLLRNAGAKEVHMRISSPPFINLCYYGTDISSKEHLIACKYSVEEIAEIIGADTLGFLSVNDVDKLAVGSNCKGFCTGCFTGEYPTGEPHAIPENKFDKKISEKE